MWVWEISTWRILRCSSMVRARVIAPASTTTSPTLFAEHLDFLAGHGFRGAPLGSTLAALTAGEALPDSTVCLTFDDAWRDVGEQAWPLVAAHGWTAPEYWLRQDGAWSVFTLAGRRPLDLDEPAASAFRLEVEGEPEVRDGLVYLQASSVRLLGRGGDDPEG